MNPAQAPTNISAIDSQLNAGQQQAQTLLNKAPTYSAMSTDNITALAAQDPSTLTPEEKVRLEIETEVGDFTPPEAPDFSDMYAELSKKHGITALEEMVTTLRNDYRGWEAMGRERRNIAMNQQVSMDVIGGRTSEIDRQTNEQLDAIGRQIQYAVDMQTAAMNTVQMIMQFEQVDYQNAFNSYKAQFDAKLSTYTLKKDLEQQLWDRDMAEKQFQQQVAFANLSILAEMAANGSYNYDGLSPEQRMQITKMETQAGLPVGFLSKIQPPPQSKIISTSTYTDADGYEYFVSAIMNADGTISTQKAKIGRASSSGSSGGGGGTAGERQRYTDAEFVKGASVKGDNPARQATILALQRFGKSGRTMVTDNKTQTSRYVNQSTISEQALFDAVDYLATTQGISPEAASLAIDQVIRSHHYKII